MVKDRQYLVDRVQGADDVALVVANISEDEIMNVDCF